MEADSDSAFAILCTIDSSALRSEKDKAFYALLSTQARVKTNRPVNTDSAISAAVEHFEAHGPDSILMKALFYQGQIRYYVAEYAKAIVPAMRSREMAINADNPYWQAKASELIADVFRATYYTEGALKFNHDAIENYLRANKELNHRFSLADKALLLDDIGKSLQAQKLLDSLLKISDDEILSNQCLSYKYAVFIMSKQYDEADKVYNLLNEKDPAFFTYQDKIWKASIELSRGNIAYMDSVLKSLDLKSFGFQDSLSMIQANIMIHEHNGDFRKALVFTDSILKIQNTTVTNILKQSVVSAQRDFYNEEVRQQVRKNQQLDNTILMILSFVVMMCGTGIYIHRTRVRNKNLELDRKIKDILLLSHSLEVSNEENRMLSNELHQKTVVIDKINIKLQKIYDERILIYKEKWDTIVFLCNQYYESNDTDKDRVFIAKQIKNEIQKLKDKRTLSLIEENLDKYTNGCISKIRTQCPWIKEEDVTIIIYSYAGFSAKAICFLLGLNMNSFYSRRRRLIEKILKSDASDKAEFVGRMK